MLAINEILQWAADNGYANMYGNPAHINRMMHDTDFAASAEQTAVYCYLITAAETMEARDRVTVGVFFARLCEFDFDPKGLLPVQMELMDTAKRMLSDLTAGNVIGYDDPVRWQFGYDDFAENVAWVCARVTFMDLAADCVPMPRPEPKPVNAYDEVTQGWAEQFGYTPLSNGFNGFCNIFGWIGISDTPLTSYTYSINGGEELNGQIATCMEVDDLMVEMDPFMAPYLGKYLIVAQSYYVHDGGPVEEDSTVVAVFDGVRFAITYDFSQLCG